MYGQDKNLVLQIQVDDPGKGNLHLGNIWAAESIASENTDNIKAILTVASNTNLKYKSDELLHKIIEADDHPNFNLSLNFDEGVQFIHENLQERNVLVHCFAGVSRSTTLILAYLMKHHNFSLDNALKLVRQKRAIAGPNIGFMKQLQKYESELSLQNKK